MRYTSQGEGAPKYMKDIYEDDSEESPEEKESKEDERLREFQEKAMELLELYGVVEQQEGRTIVDIEKIKNFSSAWISGSPTTKSFDIYSYNKKREASGYTKEEIKGDDEPSSRKKERFKKVKNKLREIGANYYDLFEGDARHFLLSAFKDKKVLTKKEFEEEKEDEKPLFYHPKNKEEAFNREKIKNADFHIGPWEINTGTSRSSAEYSPFIEDLNYTETSLAAIIYNKNYGDGKRKNGELMVRDVDYDTGEFSDTERRRVALDWIIKGNKFYGSDLAETGFKLSPRKSLEEGNYENLQKNELLRPEDFRMMPEGETAKKYGLYKVVTEPDGYITLDNHIQYGLGKEYAGGDYAVTSLGKNSYGIVKLDENNEPVKLEATLDQIDPNKVNLTSRAGKIKQAGVGQLDRLGYINELSEDDEWSDINISEILEAKKEVVKNTDVSLEGLSEKELLSFIQFYKNKKENEPQALEKVNDFVKTYGVYGLRSFAALQYSGFDGEDIIKIMDTPETRGDATPVFRKYSEIMDKVDDLEEEVKLFFQQKEEQDIDTEQVSAEMINRASEILTQGLEARNKSYKEIEKDLEELNEEIITFTSIFKTAFKGEEEVDFEAVKGLSFESKRLEQIDEKEKEEMKSIYEKNWKSREGGENISKRFKKTLEEDDESEFYILKKDGQIIAYINIKETPQEDHKKATSLNVDPDYRSSAIGWSMLQNTLDKESEDNIIDATVLPELRAGTSYVNDFGFNIIGTEEVGSRGVFTIQINKEKNENTKTRSEEFNFEKIKSKYEQKFEGQELREILNQDEPPDYFIKKYNVVDDQQQVLNKIDQATDKGYEVTGYFEDETEEVQNEEVGSPERYFVFEKVEE